MNNNLCHLFDKLGKTEYYEFLRLALGMSVFLKVDEGSFVCKNNTDKLNKEFYKKIGSLEGIRSKVSYYVGTNDFENKTFKIKITNGESSTVSVYDYFESLGNNLIAFILLSIIKPNKISDSEINDLSLDPYYGFRILERNRPNEYRFIMGAGINLDKNLHIKLGDWDKLIDTMRDAVRDIKRLVKPVIIKEPVINPAGIKCKTRLCDNLIMFEEKMCNTNYIAPAILKDLDEDSYYKVLYDNLYKSFNPIYLSLISNPDLENTSIYQIGRILSEQKKGKVLTFNYDDTFENIYKTNFGNNYQPVYKGKKANARDGIQVIHPHGYLPSSLFHEKKNKKPVVLSTFEYLEGYLTKNKYAKKILLEQLKTTNFIIGNSVSDYEEQKVFYESFAKKHDIWHFLLLKKSNLTDNWQDVYIVRYFLRMGIIPLFFNDYPDITDYLRSLK